MMTANFYPHRARAPAAGGLQPRMVEWTAAWWLLQTSLTHTLTTHTLAHITVTASSLVHQRCLRHSPKQGSDANAPLALPVKVKLVGFRSGPDAPSPTTDCHFPRAPQDLPWTSSSRPSLSRIVPPRPGSRSPPRRRSRPSFSPSWIRTCPPPPPPASPSKLPTPSWKAHGKLKTSWKDTTSKPESSSTQELNEPVLHLNTICIIAIPTLTLMIGSIDLPCNVYWHFHNRKTNLYSS